MFKILKLCSFVGFFLFSVLFAESKLDLDHYRLYVTDVDPETHSFALSNKTIFQIAKKNRKIDRLPEIGTEVRFAPLKRSVEEYSADEEGEFEVLYLFTAQGRLSRVWMPEESKAHCLTYVGSESICVEPAGLISSAKYQDVFELSNGSKWMAEGEGPFSFQKGDRIFLSKINNVQWGILDVDQTVDVKCSCTKKYVRVLSVIVKPYLKEESSN